MKTITLILVLFSSILFAQENLNQFLNRKNTLELFDDMVSEIEAIDAEAISVRNKTKNISWKEYVKFHRKEFKKTHSPETLKSAFKAFGDGFVCGHAHFDFLYPVLQKKEKVISNIKLGYTYPEISFFNLKNGKTIKKINNMNVINVFHHFINYQTKSNTINDGERDFKRKFEKGNLIVAKRVPFIIEYEDAATEIVVYTENKDVSSPLKKYKEGLKVSGYVGWQLITEGYKTALLKKDSIALIKIKNFVYLNGRGGNTDCSKKAKDSTMCHDIRLIKEGLMKIKGEVNYLIFDLQGNYGGQENTPFLKMFSPSSFYDLRVQYRKTKHLTNNKLRAHLNYHNDNAENWYQQISNNGVLKETKFGDFLPARADFCRGDKNCALKPIKPNDKITSKFKKIIVLVNEYTASSADDFTFRMSEQKNVFIAGQPQSADLTYSLVTVIYYFDKNNKIQKKYIGNQERDYDIKGTPLFKFDIPYSKTVNKDGEMLQGNPLKLDVVIPLTKNNFTTREKSTLEKSIKGLLLKPN